MTKSNANPKVDFYFTKAKKWQDEIEQLRAIALKCGLDEELKWGVPCYTLRDNNIVLIHVFKDYCALLFFKGVLLKDEDNILIQQTKNVQVARQMRFTNAQDITKTKRTIKKYIEEAIEVEKSGQEVEMKATKQFDMPEEFRTVLTQMPELKSAFNKLTAGRQRGYLLYFAAAKQSKTRTARVEKYIQPILDGKGLNDE